MANMALGLHLCDGDDILDPLLEGVCWPFFPTGEIGGHKPKVKGAERAGSAQDPIEPSHCVCRYPWYPRRPQCGDVEDFRQQHVESRSENWTGDCHLDTCHCLCLVAVRRTGAIGRTARPVPAASVWSEVV